MLSERVRKKAAPCLSVSSSSGSLITRMCAYSNGFCSRHPLANQVPSAVALSHKLETDVLDRAGWVVIPVFMSLSTLPQEAQPRQGRCSYYPVFPSSPRERWLQSTTHLWEFLFSFFLSINLLKPLFSVTFLPNVYKPLWSFPIIMALPANLSENGFSAYLIPFNYLDTQGSGHTPQAAHPPLSVSMPCLHPIHLFSWIMDSWLQGEGWSFCLLCHKALPEP